MFVILDCFNIKELLIDAFLMGSLATRGTYLKSYIHINYIIV